MSEEGFSWPFTDERMNQVLKHLKIRRSWEEIAETAENFDDVYKYDHLMQMDINVMMQFNDIFDFGDNCTFERCRNCLIDWLSKHKEFYNDDSDEVHNRMLLAREQVQRETGIHYPFINWIPQYGGMIRKSSTWAEAKWHKKQKIDFFLPKSTPK